MKKRNSDTPIKYTTKNVASHDRVRKITICIQFDVRRNRNRKRPPDTIVSRGTRLREIFIRKPVTLPRLKFGFRDLSGPTVSSSSGAPPNAQTREPHKLSKPPVSVSLLKPLGTLQTQRCATVFESSPQSKTAVIFYLRLTPSRPTRRSTSLQRDTGKSRRTFSTRTAIDFYRRHFTTRA